MIVPLQRARSEVAQLQMQLSNHYEEELQMKEIKAQLLVLEEDEKSLSWQLEVIAQSHADKKCQVLDLLARYDETSAQMDQQNGFKRLLIEKQMKAAKTEIRVKEAKLQQVLIGVAQLQPQGIRQITAKMNPLVAQKQTIIKHQA